VDKSRTDHDGHQTWVDLVYDLCRRRGALTEVTRPLPGDLGERPRCRQDGGDQKPLRSEGCDRKFTYMFPDYGNQRISDQVGSRTREATPLPHIYP
jgi:hypothetical protein